MDHIWFFHGIGETHEGREFIAALANVLVRRAYIANERVPVGYLYILRRGIVVKLWRFLRSAQHTSPPPSIPFSHASLSFFPLAQLREGLGEDIILDVPELIDHSQAVALTYCEVYTLGRAELDELLGRFPRAERRVSTAKKKVTLQRAFIMYLAKNAGRKARSFIPRSAASGFNEVPHFAGHVTQATQMTVHQKLDRIMRHNAMPVHETPGSPGRMKLAPLSSGGGGGDGSSGGGNNAELTAHLGRQERSLAVCAGILRS